MIQNEQNPLYLELAEVPERKIPKKLGERLGENQEKILALINKNRFITIPELSRDLKISTTAVENNLAKLRKKGLLKRIGPAKGGHWKVIIKSLEKGGF